VVGFEFAAEPVAVRGWCGEIPRGLVCPVSPLGSLLQKKSGSSSCSDLQGTYAVSTAACCDVDSVPYSSDTCDESGLAKVAVQSDFQMRVHTVSAEADSYGHENAASSCLVCSEPIPIPEPKPKTPEPSLQPKLVKRVPEPPMIRAVTAPAIVEELYAEYEKAKQQVVEQQLYQQMLASQGMPARLIRTHRKSDETANKPPMAEMDKLSWRTVYTHMQTHGYTKPISMCQ